MEKPILHHYSPPSPQELDFLKKHSARTLIDRPRITAGHEYLKIGLDGALSAMYLREALVLRLEKALAYLPSDVGFYVFDAFRPRATQLALFEMIYRQEREKDRNLTHEAAFALTRQFVAHPDDVGRFPIPPHNSGGAVDIGLVRNGDLLDMGTLFDEVSPLSKTDAFESPRPDDHEISHDRWQQVRDHRRLLFHALIRSGFVNYVEEWWHFDLGDCIWAQTLGLDWFYPSME